MKFAYNLGGGGSDAVIKTMKVGATVTAGQPVMKDTNKYGECIPVTTTGSADSFGIALSGGTYSTSTEGTCEVACNPFGVIEAKCVGTAAGAALSAATKHVMTQTSASTTVITDTTNGYSNDRDGGTVIALTGANAGLTRIATSHVDATSGTVTVAFPYSVAVGDKVCVLPYAPGQHKVQASTDILYADASIAIGTGMDCATVEVKLQYPINSTNPEVFVYFILHDSIWNPID